MRQPCCRFSEAKPCFAAGRAWLAKSKAQAWLAHSTPLIRSENKLFWFCLVQIRTFREESVTCPICQPGRPELCSIVAPITRDIPHSLRTAQTQNSTRNKTLHLIPSRWNAIRRAIIIARFGFSAHTIQRLTPRLKRAPALKFRRNTWRISPMTSHR